MKRLILSVLLLLFLATTFVTDSPPPGWYQQSIPIGNKLITDLQSLDSLNGWAVTDWGPAFDTGYVFKTSNGGVNWDFQYRFHGSFFALQFTDYNTGYIVGSTGSGKVWKTTNGGTNWNIWSGFGANPIRDLFFVGQNTGWVCSDDPISGGVFKTTNGGTNWTQQLNNTYLPRKLFFVNNDTGWVGTNDVNGKLYKTTNSGQSWGLQYTTTTPIISIFFLTSLKGWINVGTGNGCSYTTDGGTTWLPSQGESASYDIRFVNDSVGYSGGSFMRVKKSTDGGKTWGYQNSPIFTALQTSFFRNDTSLGWMGTNGIIKTNDGGGPIIYSGIKPSSTFITAFELKQNYPNPFNPSTTIEFYVQKPSRINLKIYSIEGREVDELIDYEKFDAGNTYYADFDAGSLSSGVYLYQMTAWTEDKKEIFIDTKKMILIK